VYILPAWIAQLSASTDYRRQHRELVLLEYHYAYTPREALDRLMDDLYAALHRVPLPVLSSEGPSNNAESPEGPSNSAESADARRNLRQKLPVKAVRYDVGEPFALQLYAIRGSYEELLLNPDAILKPRVNPQMLTGVRASQILSSYDVYWLAKHMTRMRRAKQLGLDARILAFGLAPGRPAQRGAHRQAQPGGRPRPGGDADPAESEQTACIVSALSSELAQRILRSAYPILHFH
jgi:hypothetical protein